MKILVIGTGAREHALVWRLNQSQVVRKLYCASGNPGINQIAEPVAIAPTEIAKLLDFAREKSIDLTVVGPEDPLAAGIVDEFERAGMPIFGPTRAAAQLETSKAFAKTVMREAGVPTAEFAVFDDAVAARRHVRSREAAVVVKADGLALGKGVVVCRDPASAEAAIADAMERRKFGAAGARIVIEDFLEGEEVSFFALTDGENVVPLGLVQDHKPVFDGDRGPNTGGMGAYAPLPQFGAALDERIMNEVIRPTLSAMAARGTPYRGVLYAGLMVSGERINVIEFNARFGDPECEVLMMRWESDLAEALLAVAERRAGDARIRFSRRSAVTVVLASGGYPGEYRKGLPITGLEKIEGAEPSALKVQWALHKSRVKVFHAGTALKDGQLVTDGGRVLAATAMSADLPAAVATAYQAADLIEFEGKHLRRDIAGRALTRLSPSAQNPGN
jgi:phosphoribosylamine---glycine ligase